MDKLVKKYLNDQYIEVMETIPEDIPVVEQVDPLMQLVNGLAASDTNSIEKIRALAQAILDNTAEKTV